MLLDGLLIETVGGVFGAVTVTVIEALAVKPPESVAEAVMVCVPTARLEVEKLAPVPIWPLRLDVHTSFELMLPSLVSVALPENVIEVPLTTLVLLAGLLIETVGGVFGAVTVTVMEALAVKPPESVAEAVIVCVPTARLAEKLAPVPIWPLMLEVQTSLELRVPSCVSVAAPEN